MAPLLLHCKAEGQGDDDQLSHGDQLEFSHAEKSQGSRLVEEVSAFVRENEKYYLPDESRTDAERVCFKCYVPSIHTVSGLVK